MPYPASDLPPKQDESAAAWKARAYKLWALLDDISTLDDACKADDAAYRDGVRRIAERRGAILQSLDGQTLEVT